MEQQTVGAASAVNVLTITKDRVKAWDACCSGYRWFLDNFPQGGQFAEVYAALQGDKKYDDAGWLSDKVFAELDIGERVRQEIKIAGADAELISKKAAEASDGGVASAATTGNWASAATTGEGASAATTGYRASAATTGEGASAATTGYRASAATTGEGASAATTGNWASAATTGEGASAATTGNWASAATTGYRASAATTGYRASAATTGNWASAATTGAASVAAALGAGSRAKAGAGGAIVLVYRADGGALTAVFASLVGQNGIEADKWYELSAEGKPVEVAE